MARVTALLAVLGGLVASAPVKAQPVPSLPLVVDEATVLPGDPEDRDRWDQVSVTVRNPGKQTIVAWGVRGQIEFADGKTRPIGLSTDGAIVTLSQRGSSVLPPDGRYTILGALPSNRPAKDVRSVTAEASFVIFDDDTALGDERSIGHHFAVRADNQRVWPVVAGAFLDAMNRWTDPREVIAAADQALAAIDDEAILKSMTYLSVRRVLGTALKYPRDYSVFLKSTLEEIRLRGKAADAHAQRRR